MLVFESLLILFFFFLRQVIIHDSLLNKLQLGFHRNIVDKIAIFYCLCQVISIRRHTIFQFKNLVSILIDFIFWCRCKPNKRSIKIRENILVLIVNRTMSFIAYHQIKMTTRKEFSLLIIYRIDTVNHGLIRGKYAMRRIIIFVFHQISAGQIWKHIDEASLSLRNQ